MLKLSTKCCWISPFNAQGSRGIIVAVQVGAVKIYFEKSHPVYDQTQGTGAVFSWLHGYLYYDSITNLKFLTQDKTSSFKNPHIKIDLLLLLPRGQNPLTYYAL
jgi:hypothetical protein